MRTRLTPFLWTAAICALSAWLILSAPSGAIINADLMALLPTAERDPVVHAATANVTKRFEQRVATLVGADDFETAKAAADHVAGQLAGTGQFHSLHTNQHEDLARRAISFYLPLRFSLLTDEARAQLRDGSAASFERGVVRQYFNPQSTVNSGLIENDPLLLLPRFLQQRAAQTENGPQIKDGYLTISSGGKFYILLLGELAGSPFSLSLQHKIMPLISDLRSRLPDKFPGAAFLMAGALPHAAAGTESALDETSTVGVGSIIGIIVLLLAVFRSVRPMILAVLSIGLGCLGGFAASILVFGEVHLLTFVFGASLVGISVDYSLHYFCERFRFATDWSPQSALHHIMPGITLGLITSVIGFAGLFFAPFPGMQGMAVFSSVGLCIAYGTIVICYPQYTRNMARPGIQRPLEWMRAYGMAWQRRFDWRAWSAIAILIVLAVMGSLRLTASDDIRLLQTLDAHVMAEERRFQKLMGQSPASQFFLVEGRDDDDFLERSEALNEQLHTLRKNGQLGDIITISDFIPSPRRQAENHMLLTPLIPGVGNGLERVANQVGLPEATRDAYVNAFKAAKHAPPATLAQWLADPISEPYRHLWLGRTERGVIGVVGLRGVIDLNALQSLAKGQPKLHFIDPAGEISDLFREYRRQTIWLTLISYGAVLLLLLVRYGLVGGLLVMAAPAIAAIASLGVLGWLGEPINLFNVMALLLVLGIGIDYALFFRETGAGNPPTLLAIALSSITTLLAFGLLALSVTPAIHSFGLTILIGISVAFLLSPMAGWNLRQ